jgi:hypothetical protein
MIAVELLKVLNRVTILMEKAAHRCQDSNIRGAIEPATSGPLHWADEREFSLPKSQHMLSNPDLISSFRNGPKRLGAFRQDREPLLR